MTSEEAMNFLACVVDQPEPNNSCTIVKRDGRYYLYARESENLNYNGLSLADAIERAIADNPFV